MVPCQEAALYDLTWKRTVALQITDTVGSTVHAWVSGKASDARDGFRRVYSKGTDDVRGAADVRPDGDEERQLPALGEGDAVDALANEPTGHATQPPARFTEAPWSGSWKPLDRPPFHLRHHHDHHSELRTGVEEVHRLGSHLHRVFGCVNLLERHFSDLVDYAFTARMEDELDNIATGDEEVLPWLNRTSAPTGTGIRH